MRDFRSQEQQAQQVVAHLRAQRDEMAKFIQLEALRVNFRKNLKKLLRFAKERNEKLFFRVMRQFLGELLPIVYTVGIGGYRTRCETANFSLSADGRRRVHQLRVQIPKVSP